MTAIRRAIVAVFLGLVVGVVMKMRNPESPPSEVGRWRELTPTDFR